MTSPWDQAAESFASANKELEPLRNNIRTAEIQRVAQEQLGRDLSGSELEQVLSGKRTLASVIAFPFVPDIEGIKEKLTTPGALTGGGFSNILEANIQAGREIEGLIPGFRQAREAVGGGIRRAGELPIPVVGGPVTRFIGKTLEEQPVLTPIDIAAFGIPVGRAATQLGKKVVTRGAEKVLPAAGRAAERVVEPVVRATARPAAALEAPIVAGRRPVLGQPPAKIPPKGSYDDFVRGADPGPPPPPPPRTPGGKPPTGGQSADDVFERIRIQRTRGESPDQTLLRRHGAALRTAELEARLIVDEGSKGLKALGIGRPQRGRLVPQEKDIPAMDGLFDALNNPSRVASGELQIPKGFEAHYQKLRGLTNWEEAFRLDFDSAMATVDDYFYRGWLPPEGAVSSAEAVGRGRLVAKPAFKKPRVNATYREMRDAGFEPLSWNPYEQWRISRLQGVRYRQQMMLVDDLKRLELAKPDGTGIGLEGWRTPKIGPAFEGKPFAILDDAGNPQALYTRRLVVQDNVAKRLENLYGVPPDLGTIHIGKRGIPLLKAIDAVVFIPKRAKLFASFFQQNDFGWRNYFGAWTGMLDALMAGQPITAVKRLAVWPQSALTMVRANLGPGARVKIRQALNSTKPLVPGRPGVHLRGIMEAGLSTIDTTLLPTNLDKLARNVAQEAGLLGNKAIRRWVGEFESAMRRGLFEGWYPAAQITDIRNNIAPMMVRRFAKETDEAINGMIAQTTNKLYSTIPAEQSVVQNRFIRESLKRLMFSMGESEGLLRQATGAVRGPQAAFFRTRWIGAFLGVMAVANTIHYASTGEILPLGRWSPVSRDKWGPLPLGYNRDFASPDIPIVGPTGRRLLIDLVGQMDTAFRILDPPSFITARESVPVRSFVTQTTEKDFFGRRIDKVGPGGIVSRISQLITDLFAPIGPGQAALGIISEQELLPEGAIPPQEKGLGTVGRLIQATGVNLRRNLEKRWESEFKDYDDIETDKLKRAKKDQPLSRTQYREANPEIDAKLFISGRVQSLQSSSAVMIARQIIQEEGMNPDDIQGIQERKKKVEDFRKANVPLERNEVDTLIGLLTIQAPSAQPTPQPTPTPASPGQRWLEILPSLDSTLRIALDRVWYKGGTLTKAEEARLQVLHRRFSFGEENFNSWLRQRLRQVFEGFATEQPRPESRAPETEERVPELVS